MSSRKERDPSPKELEQTRLEELRLDLPPDPERPFDMSFDDPEDYEGNNFSIDPHDTVLRVSDALDEQVAETKLHLLANRQNLVPVGDMFHGRRWFCLRARKKCR